MKKELFELHRAKTNEVQYSWDLCDVSTISCSGDLIKHILVTNMKFSVISLASYYWLELLALENKEPQYIIEFAINVLIEPDKKFIWKLILQD